MPACVSQAYFLEPLLDEIDDGFFCFRRDRAVTLGLDKAFIRASSGLPILAPEIALLYKSRDLDAKNWARFHAALPALDAEQRAWLQAALTRLDSAHPWLPALDVGDTPAG